MALQGLTKAYSDDYGNTYASAYFVISTMGVDYVHQRASIHINVYGSQAALNTDKLPVDSLEYNIRQNAYNRDSDGFAIPAFITLFPANVQSGYGINISVFRSFLLTTPELTGAT